jgi:hypothetical protein
MNTKHALAVMIGLAFGGGTALAEGESPITSIGRGSLRWPYTFVPMSELDVRTRTVFNLAPTDQVDQEPSVIGDAITR